MVGADDECLGEPVGLVLHRVGEVDAELRTVAEQPLKLGASSAVVITRMSRIPAMISVESG